ncbi:acyltransferase [Enterovibrio sp. ZSDZ35]|uniref:Acyltransferase n=1 Tax=Enterovibrio qingdaonensis TaxID=2899818 RepID=A0ABT5QQ05_9GAMM|nr:acyltransferase [Enterovibrio sp. ZSDZ35]MDD1782371.1 acyltransferase [Enterovibrio sp. ZSDZ35]
MSKEQPLSRMPELDALRGISALMVVAYHYLYRYIELYSTEAEAISLMSLGKYGVQLFFCISGFVIYWSVQNSKMGMDFIVARVARLYPAYICAIVFTYTMITFFGLEGREHDFITLIKNIVIFHNFLGISSIDGVYWTLSYEVVFYMWVFIICTIFGKEHVLLLLSASYLLITGGNFFIDTPILKSISEKVFLYKYIPFFIIGILSFKAWEFKHIRNTDTLLAFMVILISTYINANDIYIYILCIGVFYLLVNGKLGFLNVKPLTYLGMISYSLYLIHQNFGYIILGRLESIGVNIYLGAFIAFSLSVLVSTIFYYAVEGPTKNFLLNSYRKKINRSEPYTIKKSETI